MGAGECAIVFGNASAGFDLGNRGTKRLRAGNRLTTGILAKTPPARRMDGFVVIFMRSDGSARRIERIRASAVTFRPFDRKTAADMRNANREPRLKTRGISNLHFLQSRG